MAIEMWNDQQIIFSRAQGNTDQGTVTALPNGNYVVVWRDGLAGQTGIRYQIFNAAGEKVMPAPQLIQDVNPFDPEVTALSNGEFVISWSTESAAIESQRFDINGGVIGARAVVSAKDGERDKQAPALWADDEGLRYITVWSDTDATSNSIGFAWNLPGGRFLGFINTGVGAKNPDVTGLDNDKFVVTWVEGNDEIKAVIIDNATSNPPVYRSLTVPVGPGTTDVLGNGSNPVVTALNDGGNSVIITYRDNSGTLRFRGFNNDGASPEHSIDTDVVNHEFLSVPLTKGGFEHGCAIAYTKLVDGDHRLFVKLLKYENADILPVAVQVPGNADARISSITELADGRISITWDYFSVGSRAIYNRIIDARETGVTVNGTEGADYYIGTGASANRNIRDMLNGAGGNDRLEGGANGDNIDGGEGLDAAEFRFAKAGVAASLTTNTGTKGDAAGDVYTGIENLYGSQHNDIFEGSAGINHLTGWNGNDVLDGKGGADILDGSAGNDAYYVDNAADRIMDAAGNGSDIVYASATYSLSADVEIEVLVATGTEAINLTGNGFSNAITGNAAANVLDGGIGADAMSGEGGNDTFYIDNAGDRVSGGSGTDTVLSFVNFTLGGDVENLTAMGNAGVQLKGSNFANTIAGNAGANKILGGLGNDLLRGGTGKDVFVFDTTLHKTRNVDRIYDYKSKDDSIWLDNKVFTKLGSGTASRPKKFKADMFVEGKKAQDREDRIVYDRKTGALYYDKDGTGGSAQVKIATLTNKTTLKFDDFFVI